MLKSDWYELVKEVETYLYNLQKASTSVGDLFYDNISIETIEVLETYLRGYDDITKCLYMVTEESTPFDQNFKETFNNDVEQLFKYTEHIKTIVQQEHFVQLADLMKYEITEHINNVVAKLKEYNYSE